jgi:hypothetical protein
MTADLELRVVVEHGRRRKQATNRLLSDLIVVEIVVIYV